MSSIERVGRHGKPSAELKGYDVWRILVLGEPPRGKFSPLDLKKWMARSLRVSFPETLAVEDLTALLDTPMGTRRLPLWQTKKCVEGGAWSRKNEMKYCKAMRDTVLHMQRLVVEHSRWWRMRKESEAAGWGVVFGPDAPSLQPGEEIPGLVGFRLAHSLSTWQLNDGKSSLVSSSPDDLAEDQWRGGARELCGPMSYVNETCAEHSTVETTRGFTRVVLRRMHTYDGGVVADPMDNLFQTKALLPGTFMGFQYSNDGDYQGEGDQVWCARCIALGRLAVQPFRTLVHRLKAACVARGYEYASIAAIPPAETGLSISSRKRQHNPNRRNAAKWILWLRDGHQPLQFWTASRHHQLTPLSKAWVVAALMVWHRLAHSSYTGHQRAVPLPVVPLHVWRQGVLAHVQLPHQI